MILSIGARSNIKDKIHKRAKIALKKNSFMQEISRNSPFYDFTLTMRSEQANKSRTSFHFEDKFYKKFEARNCRVTIIYKT